MMRIFSLASTIVMMAIFIGAVASHAQTTDDDAEVITETNVSSTLVQVVNEDEIRSNTIPAAHIVGTQRQFVDEYLELQARSGRVLDVEAFVVAEVGIGDLGTLRAIIFVDEIIQEIGIKSTNNENAIQQSIGATIIQSPVREQSVGGSPGFGAAANPVGVTLTWEHCRALWWDAAYSINDHYVYDCVEKWKYSSQRWVYNRYTLFDPANGDDILERGELIDATIRTRPWKKRENVVTGGPYQWAPNPSSSCTTYTAGIAFGSVASLSIPIASCNARISVTPNSSDHSMKTDWNGRNTGQVYLEYAFAINTNGTPFYADYVFLEVEYCVSIHRCFFMNPSEQERWTDKGW